MAFSDNYFPATFGIQGFNSDWSLYDAENLQAKAVGWDATYALSVSQAVLDACGERDAIFKAFRAWQNARALGVFSKPQKLKLRDPDCKFHLEQTGEKTFVLYPVKEIRLTGDAGRDAKQVAIVNPYDAQVLQFSLRVSGLAKGCVITLPDGSQISSTRTWRTASSLSIKGARRIGRTGSGRRSPFSPLRLPYPAGWERGPRDPGEGMLPQGESKIGVQFPGAAKSANLPFELTAWASAKGEAVGK